MLDFTRFVWYDYLRNGNHCGFLLRKFHISGIINSPLAYEAPRAAAITVASIARSHQGFLFGTYKAESTAISLVGRAMLSKGLSIMRAAMRDSLPYYLKICQHNIPNLSQLNPTLESPGNFTSASDSPASIFPLFPQQYRPCEFSLPIPWQAWAASIFGSIGVQSHIPFLDSVANDRRLWLDAYTTLKPGEVKGSVSRHLYGQCDGAGDLFTGGAA